MAKSSEGNSEDAKLKLILEAVTVVGVLFLATLAWVLCTVSVPTGSRGILLQFGQAISVLGEGLSFKLPFIQSVVIMNVQTQKYEEPAAAASKDLQNVMTNVAVNYRVNPESSMKLYRSVGENYQSVVLAPAVSEVVKSVTAKYTAEELITKREAVREQIQVQLSERVKQYDIDMEALAITNFEFSSEFTKAIEAKVTAEQSALQSKNMLEQVKIEAQQTITKATAEAESLRLQNEQLSKSKDVLSLRMIEKWDGHLPLVMGSGQQIMGLDLAQLQAMQTTNYTAMLESQQQMINQQSMNITALQQELATARVQQTALNQD